MNVYKEINMTSWFSSSHVAFYRDYSIMCTHGIICESQDLVPPMDVLLVHDLDYVLHIL